MLGYKNNHLIVITFPNFRRLKSVLDSYDPGPTVLEVYILVSSCILIYFLNTKLRFLYPLDIIPP